MHKDFNDYIDQLKKEKYPILDKNESQDEEECTICLNKYGTADELLVLNCD